MNLKKQVNTTRHFIQNGVEYYGTAKAAYTIGKVMDTTLAPLIIRRPPRGHQAARPSFEHQVSSLQMSFNKVFYDLRILMIL